MNAERAWTVYSPWWKGVTRNHRSIAKSTTVLGWDTETVEGHIYFSGLYTSGRFESCYGLDADHLGFLVNQLRPLARESSVSVFCHFLSFDLSSLLYPIVRELFKEKTFAPRSFNFVHQPTQTTWEVHLGRPCFAKIRFGHKSVSLFDTFGFFTMSLDRALAVCGENIRKLKKPARLGKIMYSEKYLAPYLQRDCEAVYRLGCRISGWFERWDVASCVSAPQLASRIFRHHFLEKDFVRPSKPINHFSMLAYHGGKNRCLADPGWYDPCRELDITSAYPDAMMHLPNFYGGRFHRVKKFAGPKGIYCVSGFHRPCAWGCLHSHDFKPLFGQFSRVWVTGWELQEAFRAGEVEVTGIRGYVFRSTSRKKNPFQRFVRHFFKEKQQAPDKASAQFPKLILNSLYGKFLQRVPIEETGERMTGTMFYPFIAALVTGYVNAKIHRLEHKYLSLHTATDSIKTQFRPDPADLGNELGQLKVEIDGPCLILRNKLYVHRSMDGKHIKVGLHGFQGGAEKLQKLWESGTFEYSKTRLTRWAESWRKNIQPGQAMIRKMELKIDKRLRRSV